MYTSDPLWQRISLYHPDKPGVELSFSQRLARENGWNRRFALRAIEEYKRFMYLVCSGTTPVTPSETVDQVWHLHLIYSKLYWEEFCGAVLQQPVHHSPTEGGKIEQGKFAQFYSDTLQRYQETFGEAPPSDIWPPLSKRFGTAKWRWVDLKRFWLVPKW